MLQRTGGDNFDAEAILEPPTRGSNAATANAAKAAAAAGIADLAKQVSILAISVSAKMFSGNFSS
jgi:hypothetical protein